MLTVEGMPIGHAVTASAAAAKRGPATHSIHVKHLRRFLLGVIDKRMDVKMPSLLPPM